MRRFGQKISTISKYGFFDVPIVSWRCIFDRIFHNCAPFYIQNTFFFVSLEWAPTWAVPDSLVQEIESNQSSLFALDTTVINRKMEETKEPDFW